MKPHDWDELCRAHGPLVWSTVYRVLNSHADALDCYQEVFLDAIRRTADRPVEDWPSLFRWLSVRRAIDALRRRKRLTVREQPRSEPLEFAAARSSSRDAVELQELMERLTAALAKLPDRQAEAFWLRSVEQMSYAEIATQMETDTNEVGVLIHRARQSLRPAFTAFDPSPQEQS